MGSNTLAYDVLLAAHRVADELDELDPQPWSSLGGVSLGGAIRHETHEAYGVTIDDCPACKFLAQEFLDNIRKN